MTKSLITGGAGFIGSNMVRFLLDRGQQVRVLDSFATGRRENLAAVLDSIELIEGDVRDAAVVDTAVRDVDAVYHLAALGSVPRSLADPRTTYDVNATGTFNVLEACRARGVKRVVFSSSSSVYGANKTLPQHEALPTHPISPYAASKVVGESFCKAYAAAFAMETVCLRYYNVFGPRQDPTSQYAAAIPLFVSALLRDKSPTIYDDGEQSRGFTYIDNVLEANYLGATVSGLAGESLNISTQTSVSVNHVVESIQRLLGKTHVKPHYAPPRPGDIRCSLANISRAQEVLGYSPRVNFDEGIQRAIDWYRENLA